MSSDDFNSGRRAVVSSGLWAGMLATATGPAQAATKASPSRAGGIAEAVDLGVRPDTSDDQTASLQRALARTAQSGQTLQLAPGRYHVAGLVLPPNVHLVGPPSAILVQGDDRPLMSARGGDTITLRGLTLRGNPASSPSTSLILLEDIKRAHVIDSIITGAKGTALRLERCGGRVERNTISEVDIGIFSLDASGLAVIGNVLEQCGNNGIQIWRSVKGHDGTQVLANRIRNVRARSGGSGENGNAINLFRAGGVIVAENAAVNCAFSAIRNNAGDNVQIAGNSCTNLGEVAIFAEFGFEGCVITNNLVDKASVGISITNFNEGGRLAVASGNILRNLFRRPDALTGVIGQGVGIAVEADASVTGNVVDGAEFAGLSIGYGPYLRDVLCSSNVVRKCGIGIAASVAERAGFARITNNLISECVGGGIVGFAWDRAVAPNLTLPAEAIRFGHLSISDNTIR